MMQIIFNQQKISITQQATLKDLLQQQGYESGNFSVVVNQEFILRANYVSTMLNENDIIDIIKPMQGG